MAKRKQPFKRVKTEQASGRVARSAGQTLTTHAVGALPILNEILERMRLEKFLAAYLPREDGRTKVRTSRVLMLLVKNMLVARDPVYGVGEWAAGYAPDLLGLSAAELDYLNDDRGGRSLENRISWKPWQTRTTSNTASLSSGPGRSIPKSSMRARRQRRWDRGYRIGGGTDDGR